MFLLMLRFFKRLIESLLLLIHVLICDVNPAKTILSFILNTLVNLTWWLLLTFLYSLAAVFLRPWNDVEDDFHKCELFYFLKRVRQRDSRAALGSKRSRGGDFIIRDIYSKLRFGSRRLLNRRLEFYLTLIQDQTWWGLLQSPWHISLDIIWKII